MKLKESMVVALISGSFALVVGFLAMKADVYSASKGTETQLISILYDRVSTLEKRQTEMSESNKKQSLRITQLTIELAKKYESSEVLKKYLNTMPFPAWIKVVELNDNDPVFKMWHINPKYESEFGVSNERYLGKTDFQIWEVSMAKEFYRNDLAVYNSRSNLCEEEHLKYTPLGPSFQPLLETVKVCKWATTIDGKSAIAGQLFRSGG